nr:MAG TPA: hypothetical protein [Caudoviricetes sp.]
MLTIANIHNFPGVEMLRNAKVKMIYRLLDNFGQKPIHVKNC